METRARSHLCESPAPRCGNLSRETPALASRWLESGSTALTGVLLVRIRRVRTSCITGQCHSEAGHYPARSLGCGRTKNILNEDRAGLESWFSICLLILKEVSVQALPFPVFGPTVNCMVVPKRICPGRSCAVPLLKSLCSYN